MKVLVQIFISAIAVIIASYLLPGVHLLGDRPFVTALMLAIVLSFLNTFIKPLLIVFTIPLTVFTLGIFLLFINAIIIWIADQIIDSFRVDSLWWAILFSLILSLISSILEGIFGTRQRPPQQPME